MAQVRYYPDTYHGFAVRGDPRNPGMEGAKEEVRRTLLHAPALYSDIRAHFGHSMVQLHRSAAIGRLAALTRMAVALCILERQSRSTQVAEHLLVMGQLRSAVTLDDWGPVKLRSSAHTFAGVPQHAGVPGGVAGAAGRGPLPAGAHGHPPRSGGGPRLAAATCALTPSLQHCVKPLPAFRAHFLL